MVLSLSQTSCKSKDGAKWKIEADRGTVKGKQVVLAANGFTSALHPGFASKNFLLLTRSQATAVHPKVDSSENIVFHRSASYPDLYSGNSYIAVHDSGDTGKAMPSTEAASSSLQHGRPTSRMTLSSTRIPRHLCTATRVRIQNSGETTKLIKAPE